MDDLLPLWIIIGIVVILVIVVGIWFGAARAGLRALGLRVDEA